MVEANLAAGGMEIGIRPPGALQVPPRQVSGVSGQKPITDGLQRSYRPRSTLRTGLDNSQKRGTGNREQGTGNLGTPVPGGKGGNRERGTGNGRSPGFGIRRGRDGPPSPFNRGPAAFTAETAEHAERPWSTAKTAGPPLAAVPCHLWLEAWGPQPLTAALTLKLLELSCFHAPQAAGRNR